MIRRVFALALLYAGVLFLGTTFLSAPSGAAIRIMRRAPHAAAVADTEYISDGAFVGNRNDFGGCVGWSITVGGSSITATQLAYGNKSGSTGTHAVRLLDTSGAQLGSVSINTNGQGDGYLYATLGSPVTLSASTKYWIVMDVVASGDLWTNLQMLTATAAGDLQAAYSTNDCTADPVTGLSDGSVDQGYGPPNMKYH